MLDEINEKMELCYIWIKEYKIIKMQGFNFSAQHIFEYDYDDKIIKMEENPDYIQDFFSENIINITGIIGKNGTGKSILLDFISKKLLRSDFNHFAIFKNGSKFVVFNNNIDIKEEPNNIKEYIVKYYKLSEIENFCVDNVKIISYSNISYNNNNLNSIKYININTSEERILSDYNRNESSKISESMLRFLLEKKEYIDKYLIPPIQFVKIEVINNYINDKQTMNRWSFIRYRTSVFSPLHDFDSQEKEPFEVDRDILFNNLIEIRKIIEDDFDVVKKVQINTVMNIVYDICKSIDRMNLDVKQKIYKVYIAEYEKKIDINSENFEDKIKIFIKKVIEVFKAELKELEVLEDTIIEEEKNIVAIFDKIINNYPQEYLNIKDVEHIFSKLYVEFNNKNQLNKLEKENLKGTINQLLEEYKQVNSLGVIINSYETINKTTMKDIIKYDIYTDKNKIENRKIIIKEQLNNITSYLVFMEKLNTFEILNKTKISKEELIIELTKENIQILNSYMNSYYKIRKFDYYDLKWINNDLKKKRVLSSGEEALFKIYSALYDGKLLFDRNEESSVKKGKSVLILLDEPEAYLHPEWQRKLVNNLIIYFKKVYYGYNIQLIVSSNTQFLVSDLPTKNIISIDKEQVKTLYELKLKNNMLVSTFGQNIHSLLRNSFFMNSTIGEFAKNKINDLIKDLNEKDKSYIQENKEYIERKINIIGEALIRNKLRDMLYSNLDIDKQRKIEMIDKEIQRLENLRENI